MIRVFQLEILFVWELVQAGGWLMFPILFCSVLSFAIIGERLWTLQHKKIVPENLVIGILSLIEKEALTKSHINEIEQGSPLGKVLACGLNNRQLSKPLLKEKIEEIGRYVAYDLERFMNALGTISTITPLLGLLGTVIGMIKVFTVITTSGVGDPGQLAGGISEALITTAAGLTVAIPSLIFYRFLKRKIDELIIEMEQQVIHFIDNLHNARN